MNDKSIDQLPNMIMIDERQEDPNEIIEDFYEMIYYHMSKNDHEAVIETMHDFFDECNLWSVRQMLIDQAKISIGNLALLDKHENEFIEDDEDE